MDYKDFPPIDKFQLVLQVYPQTSNIYVFIYDKCRNGEKLEISKKNVYATFVCNKTKFKTMLLLFSASFPKKTHFRSYYCMFYMIC